MSGSSSSPAAAAACVNCGKAIPAGVGSFYSCSKTHPYCRSCHLSTKACSLCKVATVVGTASAAANLTPFQSNLLRTKKKQQLIGKPNRRGQQYQPYAAVAVAAAAAVAAKVYKPPPPELLQRKSTDKVAVAVGSGLNGGSVSARARPSSTSTPRLVKCPLRLGGFQHSIQLCTERVEEKDYLGHVLMRHGATSGETTRQSLPLIVQHQTEIHPMHLPKSHLVQKDGLSFLTVMGLDPSNGCLCWWTYILGGTTHDLYSSVASFKVENLAKTVNFGWSGAVHRISASPEEIMSSGRCFQLTRNCFQALITPNATMSSSEWIFHCEVLVERRGSAAAAAPKN